MDIAVVRAPRRTRVRPAARTLRRNLVAGVALSLALGACGASAGTTPPSVAPSASPVTASPTPKPRPTPTPIPTPAGPGPALDIALVGPTGLVFDAAGNLFISACTWDLSYIYRVDPEGNLTTIAGAGTTTYSGDGGPATEAELQCPVGMAFGPDGALWFADHASNRIRRIDAAGIITTVAGSGPAGVNYGSFGGDGGPATEATLAEPWSIAFDSVGNLYIGDRDNYRVRRIDRRGIITTVAGSGQSGFSSVGEGIPAISQGMCPGGLVVDAADNILISDFCTERIWSVDSAGILRTFAGTGEAGVPVEGEQARESAITDPGVMTFDNSGALLFEAEGRVWRVAADGRVTIVAGYGKVHVPISDGMPAINVVFQGGLYGLAVDGAGYLFIADDAGAVYRVDHDGIITRFAGLAE